jgi:hypothetical protein
VLRVLASSLSRLLDRLQSHVDVPTVNPHRGADDRLWDDLPAEPTRWGQAGYAVATVLIIAVIAVTWAITAQGHPTFIYEQF